MAMSAERHRALEILAGSSLGRTEATLLAHGFTTDPLVDLGTKGWRRLKPCMLASGPSDAHHEAVVSADRWPDHVPIMRGPNGPGTGPKPG
jgi:hypothetical protein